MTTAALPKLKGGPLTHPHFDEGLFHLEPAKSRTELYMSRLPIRQERDPGLAGAGSERAPGLAMALLMAGCSRSWSVDVRLRLTENGLAGLIPSI
jgi:hypothetical protein